MLCLLLTVVVVAGTAGGLVYLWDRFGRDLIERRRRPVSQSSQWPVVSERQYTRTPAELVPEVPVCLFCRGSEPDWRYRIRAFEAWDPVSGTQHWGPNWDACGRCYGFVEVKNWAGLASYGAEFVAVEWAQWSIQAFGTHRLPVPPVPISWRAHHQRAGELPAPALPQWGPSPRR